MEEIKTKPNACVDLDGVLAYYEEWTAVQNIGGPIKGAQAFIKKLSEKYRIVIYTVRCNTVLQKGYNKSFLVNNITKWLEKNNFVYDEVYAGEGKAVAAIYIDDRAALCNPQDDKQSFIKVLKQLGFGEDAKEDNKESPVKSGPTRFSR